MDIDIGDQTATLPWGPIITAAATILAAVLTVGVTLFFTNRREVQRLDYELKMKIREERQKAYATMARITKNMKVSNPLEIADLAEAHSEIEMLTEDHRLLISSQAAVWVHTHFYVLSRGSFRFGPKQVYKPKKTVDWHPPRESTRAEPFHEEGGRKSCAYWSPSRPLCTGRRSRSPYAHTARKSR